MELTILRVHQVPRKNKWASDTQDGTELTTRVLGSLTQVPQCHAYQRIKVRPWHSRGTSPRSTSQAMTQRLTRMQN